MNKNNKFLIISIISLIIAIILTIIFSSYLLIPPKEENHNKDLITTTTVIKSTTENITLPKSTNETTITTTKNQEPSKTVAKTTEKLTVVPNPTTKNLTTSSISTTKNNATTTTTTTTTTTKIILSQIDVKRKQLQNKYGITIYYKDEIDNYQLDNYKMTKIYDEEIILNALNTIDTALSKYPIKFLNELNNYKPLTIYIVKQITRGVGGITYNKPSSVYIALCAEGYLLENTFHHEIMHYIDCFLSYKVGSNYIKESMKKYNPEGFIYGDTNNDYVYYYSDKPYFLSSYAKTNHLEDRATIFADMMFRTLKKDYYSKGNPINEKAKLISNQLSDNFNSVSNTKDEYWNRHIAW